MRRLFASYYLRLDPNFLISSLFFTSPVTSLHMLHSQSLWLPSLHPFFFPITSLSPFYISLLLRYFGMPYDMFCSLILLLWLIFSSLLCSAAIWYRIDRKPRDAPTPNLLCSIFYASTLLYLLLVLLTLICLPSGIGYIFPDVPLISSDLSLPY